MSYLNNVEKIIRYIKPDITEETLGKAALHPEYPSLNTVSFILDQCRIGNFAFKFKASQLNEIDLPAIAHCVEKGETYFVVINSIQGDIIQYFDTSKGEISESIHEFDRKWRGIVLLMEATENSVEADFLEKKQAETHNRFEKAITYTVIGLVATLGLFYEEKLAYFLLYCVYGIGAFISVVLIRKDNGEKSELISRFCHLNKRTDCEAVLNSKASKLFSWISWSEIGLFYFLGGLLTLFLSGSDVNTFSVLFLFNGLALPYVLFSIYYQGVVVKQWCVLCLMVQSLLVLSFMIFFFQDISLQSLAELNFRSGRLISFCYFMPVAIWFVIKPSYQKKQKLRDAQKELYFYKLNSGLFLGLLDRQKWEEITEIPDEISLGNPDASIVVTLVSNPFCEPCAQAHKETVALLEHFDFRLIVRLIGNSPEQKTVNNHLLNLASTDLIGSALDDWFKIRDYGEWSRLYPVNLVSMENSANEWAQRTQVEYTPLIFINGRRLARPYSASDLKYHIRSLSEHFQPSN